MNILNISFYTSLNHFILYLSLSCPPLYLRHPILFLTQLCIFSSISSSISSSSYIFLLDSSILHVLFRVLLFLLHHLLFLFYPSIANSFISFWYIAISSSYSIPSSYFFSFSPYFISSSSQASFSPIVPAHKLPLAIDFIWRTGGRQCY